MDNRLLFASAIQKCFDAGSNTLGHAIKRMNRIRSKNSGRDLIGEAVLNKKSIQGYSFVSGRKVIIPMGVSCQPAYNLPQGGYWITGDWASITDDIRSWRDDYGFWVSDKDVTIML